MFLSQESYKLSALIKGHTASSRLCMTGIGTDTWASRALTVIARLVNQRRIA
jgi:hypothetical protein